MRILLTRNDIARIHRVLVLDKTEAVHELDLGNLASAMGREVGFNVSFGGWMSTLAATRQRCHASLGPAIVATNNKLRQALNQGEGVLPVFGKLPRYSRVAETSVEAIVAIGWLYYYFVGLLVAIQGQEVMNGD